MSELFDLNDLLLFCQVVQEGSFAGAARRFRGSKATISRRVALLEQRLGAQLLIRTTRTVRTTEVGRDFYGRAQGILAASEDALLSISRTRGEPSGLLRVTAGVEFGSEFIAPLLNEYLANHPKVWAELDLTGRFVDLAYDDFDLGVRVGPLDDSNLSSRRLGTFSYGLFASPERMKSVRIERPEHLARLPGLVFKRPEHSEVWSLLRGATEQRVTVRPALVSNNHWVLRDAAIAGLGVVFGPRFIMAPALRAGTLVRVLPEWGSPEIPVHAVFPAQRFLAPKVRGFVEHLVARLKLGRATPGAQAQ